MAGAGITYGSDSRRLR